MRITFDHCAKLWPFPSCLSELFKLVAKNKLADRRVVGKLCEICFGLKYSDDSAPL